jgi:glutamate/aspartate transport system substrate-binding protein
VKHRQTIGYLLAAAALFAGPATAQELTGTLKNIKDTGAITLGFRDSSIPFSYLDDNQKPIGYAMDLCYKIVDAVKKELKLDKLEVKLNPVTSSTRIPLLANGTVDLECGSTTNNVERQKQIAYTNTHFLTASRYVSKKASKINAIDDLKGKSVVSTAGTTNIKQLTEANAASQHQHHPCQGSCRGVPDGRDRPRSGFRDGRHPAGEPGCRLEGAG